MWNRQRYDDSTNLANAALCLSPTQIILTSVPGGFSGMACLIARPIPACIAPHRPLSDDIAMIRCLGFSGSAFTSVFSKKAETK